MRDFGYVLRSLVSRPGPALTIVAVLASGIALLALVFALCDPILTRPLPYPAPDRLVAFTLGFRGGEGTAPLPEDSLPTLARWMDHGDVLSGVAGFGYDEKPLRFRVGGGFVAAKSASVTQHLFQVLIGRDIACTTTEALACVVLTKSAAAKLLSSGFESIGLTLSASEGPLYYVAAVLDESFVFPVSSELEAFVLMSPRSLNERSVTSYDQIVGRLQPETSADAVATRLSSTFRPQSRWFVSARSLDELITGRFRTTALGGMALGVFVLFMCAGSVSHLLFARALFREREWCVRIALGASRLDLARLQCLEVGVIAAVSVVLALATVVAIVAVLVESIPREYLTLGQPRVTGRVIAFAAFIGVTAALLSAVPAMWTSILARRHSRPTTRAFPGRTLRFGVIAVQSLLTIVLLTASIVLGRSYLRLIGQSTGFDDAAIVVTVSYPEGLAGPELAAVVERTIEAIGGRAGGAPIGATMAPLVDRRYGGGGGIFVEGKPFAASARPVTIDYLYAAGIRLREGRSFGPTDRNRTGVIVNETFAQRAWPGTPAVGQAIRVSSHTASVIGVVNDTFDSRLDRPPDPAVYWLLEDPTPCSGCELKVSYVVARGNNEFDAIPRIAQAATETCPDAIVILASSLHDRLVGSVASRTFAALVTVVFGSAAVVVSVTGLVGVLTYVIRQRTRDIAVFSALGASRGRVLRHIATDTLAATLVGATAGFVSVRFGSELLQAWAFGVVVGSWTTGIPALLALVGLAVAVAVVAARKTATLPVWLALKDGD